jgi:subtilisin family serine protease
LVAGKPISSSHRAHGSTRQPGTSMATGHAAGVAAALAAKLGRTPRELDVVLVREELLRQGAITNALDPAYQIQTGGDQA